VALGCLLLRKTSSTPAVVPGAAPALAKAGVGGYVYNPKKHVVNKPEANPKSTLNKPQVNPKLTLDQSVI
jgi:hypothetical protein